MKHRSLFSRRDARESGYALLLIMFLLALLVLATVAAAPRILTEGRREREEEMIWRGNQYAVGIKHYYMKNRRFPTSLEDLTKPKNGIRYMRQAYKDPMNKEDGSWRLIYVGPAGQLIGSLKPPTQNLQFASMGGAQLGTPAAALNGPNNAAPGQPSTGLQPGTNAGAAGEQPGDANSTSTPQSLAPTESLTIIGGNIIGVGSKVDTKSIKWYDKARNYRQFEFIWDPSKDAAGIGQQGGALNPGQAGQNPLNPGLGMNGIGGIQGGPGNPPQNPPQNNPPPQNPNPNPSEP